MNRIPARGWPRLAMAFGAAGAITVMWAGIALAASPFYPLYYTANYGGSFYRLHQPINVAGSVNQSNTSTKTSSSVTVTANDNAGYTDSGFVVEGGTLGSLTIKSSGGEGVCSAGQVLCAIKVNGTGSFGLNLWVDTNTKNDTATNGSWFNWSGPLSNNTKTTMTGQGGDQYFLGPSSSKGQIIVNGSTPFFDMANGKTYTLNELESGDAPGVSAADNVGIWIGVTASKPGSVTADITGVKVNSTPVPLGQLPEVPLAAGIPLIGLVGGLWLWSRRRTSQSAAL